MGLSISYQIVVEKHKGVLDCISEIGQGTEFMIRMPIEHGFACSQTRISP